MGMISSAFICFRFSFLLLLCCGHVRGANVVRTRMNRVSFKRRCKDVHSQIHRFTDSRICVGWKNIHNNIIILYIIYLL